MPFQSKCFIFEPMNKREFILSAVKERISKIDPAAKIILSIYKNILRDGIFL